MKTRRDNRTTLIPNAYHLLSGIGSVSALMGIFLGFGSAGLLLRHYAITTNSITGTAGLDVLIALISDGLIALGAPAMHRMSTFVLRDTVAREQRQTFWSAFVGKNEEHPTWKGIAEEWRKVRLHLSSIRLRRHHSITDAMPVPERTRVSQNRDHWQTIGGTSTTRATLLAYLIGFLISTTAMWQQTDEWLALAAGVVAGTAARFVVSFGILYVNGFVGTVTTFSMLTRTFLTGLTSRRGIQYAFRRLREDLAEERAANLKDQELVTSKTDDDRSLRL